MKSDYDFIIFDSGTLAWHLAPYGNSILILERGGWLERKARELGCQRGFPE